MIIRPLFFCWLSLVLLISGLGGLAQADEPTRIAAIGDSNTFGLGIAAGDNTYPEHLQALLGPAFDVQNFGRSGADVLSINNGPYQGTTQHANALAFNPNLVVSNLGINDFTLIENNQTLFVSDYVDLLDDYQVGGGNPGLFIQSTLPPVLTPNSNAMAIEDLQPIYDLRLGEVATNIGATGIDIRGTITGAVGYTPVATTNIYFQNDGLHLTTEGASLVAVETRDQLLESVGLGVTAFTDNVNNRALSEGQSFTLSTGSHLDSANLDQTLALSVFAMRNRTTSGNLLDSDISLRIYEGYDQTVAGDSGASAGTLIGTSTDTVNPFNQGIAGELVWSFGDLELDKDTLYSAVFVDGAGSLVNFATELDTTNSYSGGRTLGFTGVNGGLWDSEFTAVYQTTSVPEPGSMALLGSLGVCILLRRRR